MKLFLLLTFAFAVIIGNGQAATEDVREVLKLAGTTHSGAGKLLKVKRQVYPNSLATKLAKEAGYILENVSRTKRQVYGNQEATNLAKKAYVWERLSRMRRLSQAP